MKVNHTQVLPSSWKQSCRLTEHKKRNIVCIRQWSQETSFQRHLTDSQQLPGLSGRVRKDAGTRAMFHWCKTSRNHFKGLLWTYYTHAQADIVQYTQVLFELQNKIQKIMFKTCLLNTWVLSPRLGSYLNIDSPLQEKGGTIWWLFTGSEPSFAECLTAAATGRSNLSTLYLSALWSGDLIGFDLPWIPFQLGQTLHFKLKLLLWDRSEELVRYVCVCTHVHACACMHSCVCVIRGG
jgi:hypothetical protein